MTAPALADLPDDDLMALVANGIVADPLALLYARHQKALFAFLAWRSGDAALAADACSCAWEKLMQTTHYEAAGSFRAFLFRIAQNAMADARRRRREEPDGEGQGALLADDAAPPEAQVAQKEAAARLSQALLALPAPQREAVALRFFGEMPLSGIAKMAQVGEETVKSRLRYAFAHLRKILGEP